MGGGGEGGGGGRGLRMGRGWGRGWQGAWHAAVAADGEAVLPRMPGGVAELASRAYTREEMHHHAHEVVRPGL